MKPSSADIFAYLAQPLFNQVTADRSAYFKGISVPELPKKTAHFNWSSDGISVEGPRRMTIEIAGESIAVKAYLFGLMFLYSLVRPILNESSCALVNEVIHARVTGGFWIVGGTGDHIDLEDAVRTVEEQGVWRRYVIRIFDDDESTCYLFVDDIMEAAAGLCAVPSDLEMEMREDIDLDACSFIDLQDVDLDDLFKMGSTWDSVVRENGKKAYAIKDVPAGAFSAIINLDPQ